MAGTWCHPGSPIVPWVDNFANRYNDKARDPAWNYSSGTWDTSTTPGWLSETIAGAGAIGPDIPGIMKDFVFDTEIDYQLGTLQCNIYLGVNVTAVVDTTLTLGFRDSDNRIILMERVCGAWSIIFQTTAYEVLGVHKIKIVRLGAVAKVYWDGILIGSGPLAVANCINDGTLLYCQTNIVLKANYWSVTSITEGANSYMTSPGVLVTSGIMNKNVTINSDSINFECKLWEDFRGVGNTGDVGVNGYWDGVNGSASVIKVFVSWDGTTKKLNLKWGPNAGDIESVEVVEGDWVHRIGSQFVEHSYLMRWHVPDGTNIKGVSIFDLKTKRLLLQKLGISYAYTGLNVELDVDANGIESGILGPITIYEEPVPTQDFISTPIFHGEIRKVNRTDESGLMSIEVTDMAYPLSGMDTQELQESGSYFTLTDIEVLEEVLTENGEIYWEWFHYWNTIRSKFAGTWISKRMFGATWLDILKEIAGYSGLQFQPTPEQQFLFTDYYRDFYLGGDPLEIGNDFPQGIYWSGKTCEMLNRTQESFLKEVQRVDDAYVHHRADKVKHIPTNFAENRTPTGAPPATISWPQVGNTGMLAGVSSTSPIDKQTGLTAPARMDSTLGAGDTAMGTGPANPALTQGTINYNRLININHMDQFVLVQLLGSKGWYRPMDIIRVALPDEYSPILEDIAPRYPPEGDMYVVQEVTHQCRENMVEYVLGRIQLGDQEEVYNTGYDQIEVPSSILKGAPSEYQESEIGPGCLVMGLGYIIDMGLGYVLHPLLYPCTHLQGE